MIGKKLMFISIYTTELSCIVIYLITAMQRQIMYSNFMIELVSFSSYATVEPISLCGYKFLEVEITILVNVAWYQA